MSNQWYLQTKTGRSGPFTDLQVMEMAQGGAIARNSLLRREGDQSWHQAGNIGGLFKSAPTSTTPVSSPPTSAVPIDTTSGTVRRTPPQLPLLVATPRRKGRKRSRGQKAFWILGAVMGVLLTAVIAIIVAWPDLFSVAKSSESKVGVVSLPADPERENSERGKPPEKGKERGEIAENDTKPALIPEKSAPPKTKETSTTLPEQGDRGKKTIPGNVPPPADEKVDGKSTTTSPLPPKADSTPPTNSSQLSTEEVVAKSSPSVAVIVGRLGSGSGFMVDKNRLATNRHVIEGEVDSDLKIYFPSRTDAKRGPHTASLEYVDPKRDLAFLKIECDIAPLPTAENYKFASGQDIIAIGSPGVFVAEGMIVPNAVSKGVLSAEITSGLDGQRYFQMGIAINHGNSGGPILNLKGEVVGVAAAGEIDFAKDQITYCVPVADLMDSQSVARKQGPEAPENLRSIHRVKVVYLTAEKAGKYYGKVFEIYKEAAREAVNTKTRWQSAVLAVKVVTAKNLPLLTGANLDAIKSHAAAAASDTLLADSARKTLVETLSNLSDTQRFVDAAEARSLQSFFDKMIELQGRHESLIKKLKLELGVSD